MEFDVYGDQITKIYHGLFEQRAIVTFTEFGQFTTDPLLGNTTGLAVLTIQNSDILIFLC